PPASSMTGCAGEGSADGLPSHCSIHTASERAEPGQQSGVPGTDFVTVAVARCASPWGESSLLHAVRATARTAVAATAVPLRCVGPPTAADPWRDGPRPAGRGDG